MALFISNMFTGFQQKCIEGTEDEEPGSDIHLFLPANPKGQSRIQNEFEVLKWLGKGAFGYVLKVSVMDLSMHLVAVNAGMLFVDASVL